MVSFGAAPGNSEVTVNFDVRGRTARVRNCAWGHKAGVREHIRNVRRRSGRWSSPAVVITLRFGRNVHRALRRVQIPRD
jgi:hypothetical protein